MTDGSKAGAAVPAFFLSHAARRVARHSRIDMRMPYEYAHPVSLAIIYRALPDPIRQMPKVTR